MWTFCRHWVWGVSESFLQEEGYEESPLSPSTAAASIHHDLLHCRWESSAANQLAILYLIGKAKSIAKGSWLRRGITPCPNPSSPQDAKNCVQS